MFKRILKILGIALASFVGAIGIGVGIYAISGGFKDEKIDILKLYVANDAGDTNLNKEEIYTLSDITKTIMCEPANATNKTLEVIISDPLVENDKEYTGGILKNPPKEITAGEEFKLEINKDANGNNIGGVVTVIIRPKGAVGITDVTLKVIVDTAIPSKSIYFTNNINDNYSTSGKNVIMAQSSQTQHVYLRSTLVNAFSLEVADKTNVSNLKNVAFSYQYYNVYGKKEGSIQPIIGAELIKAFDNELKLYNYFYKVPLVLNKTGHVVVTAKMHKTYGMEKEYNEGKFDEIIIPGQGSSDELKQDSDKKLKAYNDFLNKYKDIIDNTKESNDFFRNTLQMIPGEAEPKIVIDYDKLLDSKKYVFQTTSFTINITTVNLKSLYSTSDAHTYKVLSTERFTIDQIKKEFDLIPTLVGEDGNEISGVDNNPEYKTLFDTLKVTPYVYVKLDTYIENPDLWIDYSEIMGVLGFNSNKPLVVPLTKSEVGGFAGQGVLIKLQKDNSDYNDYITVKPSIDSSSKYWDIDFNIPMVNDEKSYNETLRALFLQFEVTGLDLNTLEPVVANTYSRIFIDYTEYDFINNIDRLTFLNSFSRMAINTDLNNTQGIYSSNKANEQTIELGLSNLISNYDSVEYKRVMYFVEENSNNEQNYSKVLTMGRYKFKTMQGTPLKVAIENELGATEEIDLYGERLLFNGTFDNPSYFIHAINASTTPIKVFAVVYLSDINGNPIDLNGRKINIDEVNNADAIELVVFDITEITSNESIYIDSFVSNLNYYTKTKIDHTITTKTEPFVTYQVSKGDFVKRNHITSYQTEDGMFDNDAQEELMEFLKLKLLADNIMDIYVTNFELGNTGDPTDIDEIYIPIFTIKDFFCKEVSGLAFNINTVNNKQIAFNRFCEEYNLNDYELEGFPEHRYEVVRKESGEAQYIQIKLRTDKKIGDSIRIKAKGSAVINDLKDSDYVNWQVTSLEVSEVKLVNVDNYYRLYVRSSEDADKDFDFVETTLDGYSRNYSDHVLFANENKQIGYEILTNLYNGVELNMDLVDMAQADYNENIEESEELYVYANISSYISEYCDDNTQISYLTCDASIQLKEDLVFKSKGRESDDNEYIYVGSNKFATVGNSVTINGKTYFLEGSPETYQLRIAAGEYFPVVNNSENRVAIILGEEIKIEYFESTDNYLVYNCDREDNIKSDALVEFEYSLNGITSKYSSHDYIYDGSKDNSDTNSAITFNASNEAVVNFKKGGVIENVYNEDPNGIYKLEDGNYVEAADDEVVTTRYSKGGIQAFLMVTFDGDVYDKAVTKVITYELIQEEITITAFNKTDVPGERTVNSESNPMTVEAGKENYISIGSRGDNSINLSSPIDRLNFFSHVTFKIEGQGDVSFKHNTENTFIKEITPETYSSFINSGGFALSVPDTYHEGGEFTISLSYNWIDEDNNVTKQTKVVYFTIKNNFLFKVNEEIIASETGENKNTLGGLSNSDTFTLSLEDEKTYKLSEVIAKYFIVNDETISFEVENNDFVTINGDDLTIGKSYAVYDGEKIVLDKFILNILLTKNGKTIYAKPITITILPDYVVDLTGINDSTQQNPNAILNGECIYDYDYIKLYEYKNVSELGELVNDKNIYTTIFTLTDITDEGSQTCENGIVSHSSLLTNTKLKLSISYKEGLDNSEIIKEFYLELKGYNLGYAEAGDKDFVNNQQVQGAQFTINIPKTTNLDMTNFFQVSSEGIISGKHNLFMVLLDDENNIYQSLTGLSGEYRLFIANYVNGTYLPIIEWGSNAVTVLNVNLFYSIEGGFTAENSTWDNLNGSNSFLLQGDIDITGNTGDSIDINKYYKFFDQNGNNNISVVFRNESGQTSSLTIGSEDVTYDVCYQVEIVEGSNIFVVYNTGYKVTLNVSTSE